MTIPFLPRLLHRFFLRVVALRRHPDQIIGRNGDAYLLRWWLFGRRRNPDPVKAVEEPWIARRFFGITCYLHCFLRSDEDQACHDHPFNWLSWILNAPYWEHFLVPTKNFDWHAYMDEAREAGIFPVGRMPYFDSPYEFRKAWPAGSLRVGKAELAHRVVLMPSNWDEAGLRHAVWLTDERLYEWATNGNRKVWTLFFSGKQIRRWGFHCATGWKHWKDFDNDGGCGEHA